MLSPIDPLHGNRRPAAGTVQIPFAVGEDGRLAHVSTVPNGLACRCICPGCGAPVSAHKGKKNAQHFHHATNPDRTCENARETMLHLMAKQIVADHRRILLPAVTAHYGKLQRQVRPETMLSLVSVTLEQWLGGLRPDIIGHRPEADLLIEISVTHACEPEKLRRIQDRLLATIEIDLSHLPVQTDLATLTDAVLNRAPRTWLYNRYQAEAEQKLKEEAIAAKLEAATKSRLAEERRLAAMQAAHDAPPPPLSDEAKREIAFHTSRTTTAGLIDKTGIIFGTGGCFAVPWRAWQCFIVSRFVIGDQMGAAGDWTLFETSAVVTAIKISGYLKPGFERFIDAASAEALREDFPGFDPPYSVVEQYLTLLSRHGLLRKSSNRWGRSALIAQRAREKIAETARIQRDTKNVDTTVRWILKGIPECDGFSLEDWFHRPLPGRVKTPRDIVFDPDEFRPFYDQLCLLEQSVSPNGPVPTDFLGLPLGPIQQLRLQDAEVRRLREAAEADAARQHALEQAHIAQATAVADRQAAGIEARQRVQLAAEQALSTYGAKPFLAQPRDFLGGRSINALESVSPVEQTLIEEALEAARLALQPAAVADSFRQRFAASAGDAFRRRGGHDPEAETKLFLNTSHPALGGLRPIEACTNQSALDLCLTLLPTHQPGRRRRS